MPSMLFWDNSQMSPKGLTIWREIDQDVLVPNPVLNPKGKVQILIIPRREQGLATEGIMRDHPVRSSKTHYSG